MNRIFAPGIEMILLNNILTNNMAVIDVQQS